MNEQQMNWNTALQMAGEAMNLESDADVLAVLNDVAETFWEPMDDYPNYAQHSVTKQVRNRSTHRILKLDDQGRVMIKNTSGNYDKIKISQ